MKPLSRPSALNATVKPVFTSVPRAARWRSDWPRGNAPAARLLSRERLRHVQDPARRVRQRNPPGRCRVGHRRMVLRAVRCAGSPLRSRYRRSHSGAGPVSQSRPRAEARQQLGRLRTPGERESAQTRGGQRPRIAGLAQLTRDPLVDEFLGRGMGGGHHRGPAGQGLQQHQSKRVIGRRQAGDPRPSVALRLASEIADAERAGAFPGLLRRRVEQGLRVARATQPELDVGLALGDQGQRLQEHLHALPRLGDRAGEEDRRDLLALRRRPERVDVDPARHDHAVGAPVVRREVVHGALRQPAVDVDPPHHPLDRTGFVAPLAPPPLGGGGGRGP